MTMALRVDASAADGSQERVLKPSEPLHTGDKIALGIDVDRPASVGLLAFQRVASYKELGSPNACGPDGRLPVTGQ